MTFTYPKRIGGAGQAGGRGMDNTYQAAQYTIMYDGMEVGFIHAKARRFMAAAEWHAYIYTYNFDRTMAHPGNAGMSFYPTLRDTKAAIEARWPDA